MVRQEASLTSGFSAQQGLLQQAQASLGESVSASSTSGASTTTVGGLSAAIDSFFNAVEGFAANPSDQTQSQAVVQQAAVLTDRFQQVDSNLAQVQGNATAQVSQDVGTVNGLLQQVAQLNGQIHSLEVNDPGSAVSLRDQREGVLEQIAAYLPVTVTEGSNGEDQVSTSDSQGQPVTLVSNATVPATLSFSGGSLFAGSPPDAISPASGSLQGTLAASGGAVQALRDGLDSLARQIVTSVNAAYNPGGTAGGDFFDSSGTTAGTIALQSGLTASTLEAGPGGAGDNSTALAVGAVASQAFSTAAGDAINGTITQSYAAVSAGIGQALSTATTQLTDQTNVQTIVGNERTSMSGVSLDQEMSNLVMYQRAYQASSEVFQVIDQLLSTLATSLGSVSG
jgi:flagellar hook-associated protein 1 FlgK